MSAVYQPTARWREHGDSEFLMWGHVKVGEVTMSSIGTWYGYYRADDSRTPFRSLKDFAAPDLAKRAVELALHRAALEDRAHGQSE